MEHAIRDRSPEVRGCDGIKKESSAQQVMDARRQILASAPAVAVNKQIAMSATAGQQQAARRLRRECIG